MGLVANPEKSACGPLLARAARVIERSGREVCTEPVAAVMGRLQGTAFPDVASLAKAVDLLLVFGGDGTMLRVANETGGSQTPLLGINTGGLGFLTGASAEGFAKVLAQVWKDHYRVEQRTLIEASGTCQKRPVRACAMNDFVVGRALVSRLMLLEVSVDDEPLTSYRCDGLVVSSPTGSTAYSLSAGGAIVHPAAEVFAITPICPHTLSNRSVIVSLKARIRVRVVNEKPETVLSADGRAVCPMAAGDTITIRRSRRQVRLMHLAGGSFFETLRRKLHWSGAHV